MYNSYPPVIALCIAFVMLFCLAVPHFSNQMEQKEADVQITSGTVSNMTAETDDSSGKLETVYTIYISGSYVYDGEERIGERSLTVPLEFFMRYEMGDYVSDDEIKSVSDFSDTP